MNFDATIDNAVSAIFATAGVALIGFYVFAGLVS